MRKQIPTNYKYKVSEESYLLVGSVHASASQLEAEAFLDSKQISLHNDPSLSHLQQLNASNFL
jgi:hypothetical protein